jgi:hypothetical protein
MAEEQVADKKEAVAEKAAPSASDVAAKELENQKTQKAVEVYENLNERYKADAAFRAEFDKIWAGVKEDAGTAEDNDDLEPIEQLRKELKAANDKIEKTTSEIENLRNVYGYDKVSDRRQGINIRYENDFRSMANGVGYDPNSDAYNSLYSDVLREGRSLARKFGLVSENGEVDPLKDYNPEFLKEAFKIAYERHERAGFSDAWKRKKQAESVKRNEVQDELSQYFDPKKMKTPEGRAAALERAFKHKFGNTKMV